jgi:hypothetical protein
MTATMPGRALGSSMALCHHLADGFVGESGELSQKLPMTEKVAEMLFMCAPPFDGEVCCTDQPRLPPGGGFQRALGTTTFSPKREPSVNREKNHRERRELNRAPGTTPDGIPDVDPGHVDGPIDPLCQPQKDGVSQSTDDSESEREQERRSGRGLEGLLRASEVMDSVGLCGMERPIH